MVEERTGNAQGLEGTSAGLRYQLGEIMAEGALCTVYAGHDAVLNRPIAVKAVPPEYAASYRAALTATSTLAHPAAVITLDAVEHDGRLLLAQEYVNGTALADRLASGLSPDLAIGLGLQLARLLAYVHARGMVHGDLTPTAVLIERDHIVRVNNFGLPPDTAYVERFAGIGERLMRGLSLPGAPIDPMSPVVPGAAPSPGTPEADIYALGLLLWQSLASGRAREFRADVPVAVRDIVGRLLVPAHPQRLLRAVDLVPVLEAAAQTLHEGHDDDDQPTPSSLRQLRQLFAATQAAQPWSDAETIIQAPVSQPLDSAYPAGAVSSGPLRAPTPSGPLRAAVPSGPLPPPDLYRGGPSGPLRLASPTGPLRAAGTRQFDNPPPPELASGRETRRLSVPNSAPHPNAPLPQRAPTLSGPLRAGGTGRLDATGPIPAYRPQAAVPWRDEPQVEEWSRRPASRPASRPVPRSTSRGTAPSWPGMPERHGISLPPVLVLGLILLAICFILGYFVPYILPFH